MKSACRPVDGKIIFKSKIKCKKAHNFQLGLNVTFTPYPLKKSHFYQFGNFHITTISIPAITQKHLENDPWSSLKPAVQWMLKTEIKK